LFVLKFTTEPPVGGAVAFKNTDVCTGLPPAMLPGLGRPETPILVTTGGTTTNVAPFVTPLYVAEMVTLVDVATGFVVMFTAAEVPLIGTVGGTVATAVLLLVKLIVAAALAGTGPFNVAVPVRPVPPVTSVPFKVREAMTGGAIVSTVATLTPL
jgi:hypothetical protein